MAKISLNQSSDPGPKVNYERREIYQKNFYFDNESVERLLSKYLEGACTDVNLRDEIMIPASELIRQIIKAHRLTQICPGKDDTSEGDLFQTAWMQIESAIYKYDARPHCSHCYNNLRPNESLVCDSFMFVKELLKKYKKCRKCKVPFKTSEDIYYKGKSKVFNMWCVAPSTKIITEHGCMAIGEAITNRERLVYGLQGHHEITNSIRKDVQETIITNIMMNYNIESTPDHFLYYLGDAPGWAKVRDLKIGDFVGLQVSQQMFANNDSLSDIRIDGLDLPSEITPELAYIFGLYLAEGSYGHGMFNINNTDLEITETLQQNSFGLKFGYQSSNCKNYTCSKAFCELFEKLEFGHDAKTKTIPQRLLRMSRQNIHALLSGLFDGDGHSSRHDGNIGFTSTSQELISQVRMLLLNSGMLSKLYRDPRIIRNFIKKCGKKYCSKLAGAFMLRLSTADSLRYYDRVGFKITRKQNNITNLAIPRELIYCVGDRFRVLYKKYGAMGHYNEIRRVIDGATDISVQKAATMLQYWNTKSDDADYKFIADRLNEFYQFKNRIIWLPVTKLSVSQSEVCDIEVSSDDHSYIANGFISHNSQIARTVILAYIKKENRDRKNSPVFQNHLENKIVQKSHVLERFLIEARSLCKYNDGYTKLLDTISELYNEDDKPHEGFISKLVMKSGMPRTTITEFLKMIRLRSFEFTDSPVNDELETIRRRKIGHDEEIDQNG